MGRAAGTRKPRPEKDAVVAPMPTMTATPPPPIDVRSLAHGLRSTP